MSPATTDLCDAHEDMLAAGSLRVVPPGLRAWGGVPAFCGPVSTVRCFEDNSLVRTAVEEPGAGRVLVIDGGGSLRCALLGGNLAVLAAKNGWKGVVIDGCVRDTDEINEAVLGVRALASNPRRSEKRGGGQRDVAIAFLGVKVVPGNWCYVDADGVLIVDRPLHA